MSRIPLPGSSRIPKAGSSNIAQPIAGSSRITQPKATSGLQQPGKIGRPASSTGSRISQPIAVKKSLTAVGSKRKDRLLLKKTSTVKQDTTVKRFDRSVNEELKRRKDPVNVLVEATTNDENLIEAVSHLVKAEAMHSFAGAVQAAEEAASSAPPELAEEAAAAGVRNYQAELVDVIQEQVPGLKPIQVLGYVGITRPTRPKH